MVLNFWNVYWTGYLVSIIFGIYVIKDKENKIQDTELIGISILSLLSWLLTFGMILGWTLETPDEYNVE